MKRTDVIKSGLAAMLAGMSIYALKKQEEKNFKKDHKLLQEKNKEKLKKISKYLNEE